MSAGIGLSYSVHCSARVCLRAFWLAEMYGNLQAVAQGPADAIQEANMVGIGMCPEGIETNPIVYDLMPEWAYR